MTRGSFRARHETARDIFRMLYDEMKGRLTTWGRDEAAHQMVPSIRIQHEEARDGQYEALARPVAHNSPVSTRGVGDHLEWEFPFIMVAPPG